GRLLVSEQRRLLRGTPAERLLQPRPGSAGPRSAGDAVDQRRRLLPPRRGTAVERRPVRRGFARVPARALSARRGAVAALPAVPLLARGTSGPLGIGVSGAGRRVSFRCASPQASLRACGVLNPRGSQSLTPRLARLLLCDDNPPAARPSFRKMAASASSSLSPTRGT